MKFTLFANITYTMSQKKGATFTLPITLSNLDRLLSHVSTLMRDTDIAILSVRLSVRLSVMSRYQRKMALS